MAFPHGTEAGGAGAAAGWIGPVVAWSTRLDESALDALIRALREDGREVIGPTVRDGAVVLAPITAPSDLPAGWRDIQDAGRYRLAPAPGETTRFTHAAPAQGWKRFVHPPEDRLWRAHRPAHGDLTLEDPPPPPPPRAFLGVRPCDLAALEILDRVLAGPDQPDPAYALRRRDALVVSVDCGTPAASCFCATMDTGPAARDGFDLALVELVAEDGRPVYLARAGSPAGADLLDRLPGTPANDADRETATSQRDRAVATQTRALPPGIRGVLAGAIDSRHWDEVAARCLACGNCTLCCPTCFCATVEDSTSLDGRTAERWRRWSSCFTEAFSYIHGGAVRGDRGNRYRQWITHKLSAWHDQFGGSGCVGCGRCITWCPVGIDITAEAATLDAEAHARAGAPTPGTAAIAATHP
ncbi:4Fe-4S dicluster domain-containing protein [Roseospira visakhapatnamensis]|uniref:Fe-S-cluster-containing hydrogenase component 2 n=1 Tax=Roseospira visakhapatnamensis TaxID=390880 RepID=A0A7W6RF85_9PROT|nr:4Fe-4S dicluster domain-containing protein [Roseospira visakhapatnamensis]MBB4267337.1 Fe-S-cluster-containing hydrogenase component 2 [Roseospira visakhapatnamensis]